MARERFGIISEREKIVAVELYDPQVPLHGTCADPDFVHGSVFALPSTAFPGVHATSFGWSKPAANRLLEANVVCGQDRWWQACEEIGAPGYGPFGADTANFNIVIGNDAVDPVSGSVPHRAYLCQIRPDAHHQSRPGT